MWLDREACLILKMNPFTHNFIKQYLTSLSITNKQDFRKTSRANLETHLKVGESVIWFYFTFSQSDDTFSSFKFKTASASGRHHPLGVDVLRRRHHLRRDEDRGWSRTGRSASVRSAARWRCPRSRRWWSGTEVVKILELKHCDYSKNDSSPCKLSLTALSSMYPGHFFEKLTSHD